MCLVLGQRLLSSRAISNLKEPLEGHTFYTLYPVENSFLADLRGPCIVFLDSRSRFCSTDPDLRGSYLIIGYFLFLEMNLDSLGARTTRDYDLFWHIASFLLFCFYFYQFRFFAVRSFALRARGLINNS